MLILWKLIRFDEKIYIYGLNHSIISRGTATAVFYDRSEVLSVILLRTKVEYLILLLESAY